MRQRILILEFRNAKLIRTHVDTKDRFTNFNEPSINRNKSGFSNFVEPITKYQVSNLLHVIMGERPVNTQRACNYKAQSWIMELADKSMLKYITPKIKMHKDKEASYPKEKTTLNKSVADCFNDGVLSWETMRNYCESYFDDILLEFEKVFKDPLKIKFSDIVDTISNERLNSNKYDCIFEKISSLKGLTALSFLLKEGKNRKSGVGDIHRKRMSSERRGTAITISRAVDDAEFYSGEIIVFINDEIEEIIRNNYKGTSTILDGGMVYIKDIRSDIEADYLFGFEKVCNISIQKQNNNEDKNKSIVENKDVPAEQ